MARKVNRLRNPRPAIIATAALVVIAIAVYLLIKPGTAKDVIPSSSPQKTTTGSQSQKQQSVENSQPTGSEKSTSGSTTTTSSALLDPSGTFVSNHHPNLSGSPAPSAEQSVCNTTPGASCYIEFTNGSLTKRLASQTVDSNGSAYWSWDVGSSGLTQGSWQITAVASLNGQTKSTSDNLALVVQP